MAIKRRSSVPNHAVEESYVDNGEKSLRHPSLQGLRLDVYTFIKNNQPCTRDDVGRGLGVRASTIAARVKELIDEGYVFEPVGERKLNASGVRARVLAITDRPEGGEPLSKVRVEVVLTLDCNGVFGATASVVGGKPQSGIATPIKKQRFTLTAPHPSTYKVLSENPTYSSEVSEISRYNSQAHSEDIIDADYIVIQD